MVVARSNRSRIVVVTTALVGAVGNDGYDDSGRAANLKCTGSGAGAKDVSRRPVSGIEHDDGAVDARI